MKLRHSQILKMLALSAVAIAALPEPSYADFAGGIFKDAACDVIWYMNGSMGAMLSTAAVLVGIATAAFGDYRAMLASITVAVGSFTMYVFVTGYFGDLGCEPDAGGRSADAKVAHALVSTAPSSGANQKGAANFETRGIEVGPAVDDDEE